MAGFGDAWLATRTDMAARRHRRRPRRRRPCRRRRRRRPRHRRRRRPRHRRRRRPRRRHRRQRQRRRRPRRRRPCHRRRRRWRRRARGPKGSSCCAAHRATEIRGGATRTMTTLSAVARRSPSAVRAEGTVAACTARANARWWATSSASRFPAQPHRRPFRCRRRHWPRRRRRRWPRHRHRRQRQRRRRPRHRYRRPIS